MTRHPNPDTLAGVAAAARPPPSRAQSCPTPGSIPSDAPGAYACRIQRGVRMHPVPRMNLCLVHAADGAAVFTLDRMGWNLLELCALEDLGRVRATFVRGCAGGRARALGQFERHLLQLVRMGIVSIEASGERDHAPEHASAEPRRRRC